MKQQILPKDELIGDLRNQIDAMEDELNTVTKTQAELHSTIDETKAKQLLATQELIQERKKASALSVIQSRLYKDLSELSNTWSYQIPLNPTDCFVWKKVFFTPGMQLFGEKIAFVRQVAMFDTHTVGDADLIIADANTGKKK